MLADFVLASANFAVGYANPSVQLKYRANAAESAPVTLRGCKRSSEKNTKMRYWRERVGGENSRPAVAPKSAALFANKPNDLLNDKRKRASALRLEHAFLAMAMAVGCAMRTDFHFLTISSHFCCISLSRLRPADP